MRLNALSLSVSVLALRNALAPGKAVAPPAYNYPLPTGLIGASDSRTQRAGGYTNASATVRVMMGTGGNVIGWVPRLIANKIRMPMGYNYGVGASTSRRFQLAMNNASMATTGNSAGADTGDSADNAFNQLSDGQYSAIANPANVHIHLSSVNDSGYASYYTSPAVSIACQADILTQMSAATKVTFLLNEYPRGHSLVYAEAKTVTSGIATATNTTGFVDGQSWDAAAGGVSGVQDSTGQHMSKVASAPGVNEYTVNASGQYGFNAVREGQTVYLTYAHTPVASTSYQKTMRNWFSSSAASFTDPDTGVAYGVPGALAISPLIVPVNVWDVIMNPSTGYAKVGMLIDNLHPSAFGGRVAGKETKAKIEATWPSLPSLSSLPTRNNWIAVVANGALKTWSGTLPAGMRGNAAGTTRFNVGGVILANDGAGNLSDGTTWTGTMNETTGAWSITTTGTAPAVNTRIFAEQDYGSFIANGLMDISHGTTALPANVTGTPIPSPYAIALSSAIVTALSNGTMALDISMVTGVDGLPAIRVTGSGIAPAGVNTITISDGVFSPTARVPAGALIRGGVVRTLKPGTNGHLYGVTEAGLNVMAISTVGVVRPGNATAATTFSGAVGGTGGDPLNDLFMTDTGGVMREELLTPATDTTGITYNSLTLNLVITLEGGKPISFVAEYSQAHLRTSTT